MREAALSPLRVSVTVFIICRHAKSDVLDDIFLLIDFRVWLSVVCTEMVPYVVVEFMNESRHEAISDWLVAVQELRAVEMGCAR